MFSKVLFLNFSVIVGGILEAQNVFCFITVFEFHYHRQTDSYKNGDLFLKVLFLNCSVIVGRILTELGFKTVFECHSCQD